MVACLTSCGISSSVWRSRPDGYSIRANDADHATAACAALFAEKVAEDIHDGRRNRRWVLGLLSVATTVTATIVSIQLATADDDPMNMNSQHGKAWAAAITAGVSGGSTLTELLLSVLDSDYDDLLSDKGVLERHISSNVEGGTEVAAALLRIHNRITREAPGYATELRKCTRDVLNAISDSHVAPPTAPGPTPPSGPNVPSAPPPPPGTPPAPQQTEPTVPPSP